MIISEHTKHYSLCLRAYNGMVICLRRLRLSFTVVQSEAEDTAPNRREGTEGKGDVQRAPSRTKNTEKKRHIILTGG